MSQYSRDSFTHFCAGHSGIWQIESIQPIKGESLNLAPRLDIRSGAYSVATDSSWKLIGVSSHVRYVESTEKKQLEERKSSLGRSEAKFAALIPIKKSAAWWDLPQDERRRIFEAKSRHISGTLQYLPQIARQLYHSRDLGEPFDFLTWFEFAPEHQTQFNELLVFLRSSEEWSYVEREIDIRVSRLS